MVENDILAGFALAQKAVPLLVQKVKDDVLPHIQAHLDEHPGAKAGLSTSVKGMLASFKIITGQKGLDLIFNAPLLTQTGKSNTDIVLETVSLNADYTILLFYKGSCSLCEDVLIVLANR